MYSNNKNVTGNQAGAGVAVAKETTNLEAANDFVAQNNERIIKATEWLKNNLDRIFGSNRESCSVEGGEQAKVSGTIYELEGKLALQRDYLADLENQIRRIDQL